LHWGARFPELRFIIRPRMAHVVNFLPAFGMNLAATALEVASAWMIWQQRDRLRTQALSCATVLAWGAVLALFVAGQPIDMCFGEESCGVGLVTAQNLLSSAHLLAIGSAVACLCALVLQLHPPQSWE
jgi:hypothetical protein